MSSPPQLSPYMEHRVIAPLPVRARKSSDQAGIHQTLSSRLPQSPDPASATAQLVPSSSTPHHRRSSDYSDASASDRHLSPPLARSRSSSNPTRQDDIFKFRYTSNVTPRPSPQPAEMTFQSPHPPQTSPSPSTSPVPSSQEAFYIQPVHAFYSDEKISFAAVNELSEVASSSSPSPSSNDPFGRSFASPSRSIPSLFFDPIPELSSRQSASPFIRSRNVSDASIASVLQEPRKPYNVSDEQGPEESFFSSDFQVALQDGLDIAGSTAEMLKGWRIFPDPGNNLDRLAKDARELSTFQGSDTRTIAVLGDSGEGKSSVINSLLHCPEIAKTGDIGAACTSVVTEYRKRTNDHTAPITIEVEHLSTSEIEELVKELLWTCRQLYLPRTEGDIVDETAYLRYQRESDQAWSALESAFKHQAQFRPELLQDMSEGALARVTEKLIQWTKDIEWPSGGSDGLWKSTAVTAEECCEKTSVFMEDRLWPFTKIVRVYLEAQVLNTGVVLADLPGLQDTNLARVRATQTYLMKCDYVFIVAKISRAITDHSLKSSLYTVLNRHMPLEWEESAGRNLNLAVVCTKSEDINETTARREFCGPRKRIAQSEIDYLDKEIENAKYAGNDDLKKELKRRRTFILIDARNQHVKQGLQHAYGSKVPGGTLNTFCVSNTTYEKYSKKGNSELVRLSGIPELRRFCHSITANAKFLEVKHFLQAQLSSLINSIDIWAGAAQNSPETLDASRGDKAYKTLEAVTEDVKQALQGARQELGNTFGELVLDLLEKRGDSWESAARLKSYEWQRWHWTQYNAWCKNNGDHSTAGRPHVNWNTELIWKMRMELAYQWEVLEDVIKDIFHAVLESIKTHFLELHLCFEESQLATFLSEGIHHRIRDIEYKFSLSQQNFVREVKFIRRNASEPNGCSYVLTEMIPAYRAASQERGTGMASRQKSHVQGKINGTLFPNISTAISQNISNLTAKTFANLHETVGSVLDLFKADLDMALASGQLRIGDGGDQEEEEVEEERRRRGKVVDEVKEIKRRHEELLGKIET